MTYFPSYFVTFFLFAMNFAAPSTLAGQKADTLPRHVRILSEYVQIPSISGNERDAGLFWAEQSRSAGLHVKILTDYTDTFNFVASVYPLELRKPNIIFLNHIDVVPTGDPAAYKHPPFSGIVENGEVWGRGSIDNKGMAVMQLMAIEKFISLAKDMDLPYNITMLSVSGEETGGHTGAKIVSERFLDLLNPAVVFGEGGLGFPNLLPKQPDKKVFGVSISAKRRLWLELTLGMTSSGHGSVTPNTYVVKEKIRAMNNLLNWDRKMVFSETTQIMFYGLGQLEGGIKGYILKNLKRFRPLIAGSLKRDEIIHSLLTNTITITGVNTPEGPPNQIPQEIKVILDCRLLPDVETQPFIEELKKAIDSKDISIRIILEDKMTKATMPETFYRHLENAIADVFPGSAVLPIITPASNDNHFFRYYGVPVYGLLPVYMDLAFMETVHNANERLPVFALEQGIQIYTSLLKNILNVSDESLNKTASIIE